MIIRLSGPIKHEYAVQHNLNQKELFTDSSYKEKFRKDMVAWSEHIRAKQPDYFIKAALKMYDGLYAYIL